jgi:hypothetical protein
MEAIAVAVVYTLAHGLMLLDRGLFWDDWMSYRQPLALMADLAKQNGSTWPGVATWLPYSSAFAVWATRAAVFAAFLLVALLALRLLRRVSFFDAEARIAVASLVAVFPVMAARDAIVDWPYAISLALFMGGWALLDRCIGSKRWVSRVAALILLFLSFRTASLGLFYVVLPVWLLWRSGVTWRKPRQMLLTLAGWADVIVLPVVFWVFRSIAAKPYGLYEGYNPVTWKSFKAARFLVPEALSNSLIGAFTRMPSVAWWPVVVLGAIAIGTALWSASGVRQGPASRVRDAAAWGATALAGVALVVLGVYPYLAVDKMPRFVDFDTRHQLLVPFGAALLVVGIVRALLDGPGARRVVRVGLLAVVIGLCAGTAAGDHLSYQREWYKELGMVQALRQAPSARDGRTFVFDDRALDLNANGRSSRRFYEYAGMFERAFGTRVRLGIDKADIAKRPVTYYKRWFTDFYKLDGYVAGPPDFLVTVERGSADLHDPAVLMRLLWEEWTGSPRLDADAAATVRLTFQPAR